MSNTIIIDPEFQALIPALKPEERQQLAANLIADGCRDPLVLWPQPTFDIQNDDGTFYTIHYDGLIKDRIYQDDDFVELTYFINEDGDKEYLDEEWPCILIDGHNRYEICTRNGISFDTVQMQFPDREAAADWIDANQLGRRNLTPDQHTLLLGRRYNRVKKAKEANLIQNKPKDQNEPSEGSTAEKLAKEHGVSPATVKRAGQYAEAVDTIAKAMPDIAPVVAPRQAVIKAAALLEKDKERAESIISGTKSLADVTRETKRAELVERLESVAAIEAKAAQGVYDVIVLDPPWPMQKIERDVRPNQSEFDYPTMSEEELAALEIPAADDCHAWVWTTHKFLPMALRLIEAWGMKYVCTFTWHKPGGFQPIGLPQYNCEFALYARKGAPKFIDTQAFPVCFQAPRGAHSEKPEEFYDVLRRVTAGRRLDMFNRRAINGFDVWGKEAA